MVCLSISGSDVLQWGKILFKVVFFVPLRFDLQNKNLYEFLMFETLDHPNLVDSDSLGKIRTQSNTMAEISISIENKYFWGEHKK